MQGNPTPQWSNIGTIPTLLSNLGNLTDEGLIEHVGSGVISTVLVSPLAKTLLDDLSQNAMLTTLGGTTTGKNFFTLPNPEFVAFPRINDNGTVTARSAADFLTDIGAATAAQGNLAVTALQPGDLTSIEITLTPINSFTGSGILTIYPGSRMGIVDFNLSRAASFTGYLNALSWDSTYQSINDVYTTSLNNGLQSMRQRISAGTSVLEVLSGGATFPVSGLLGQIIFKY